MIAIFVEGRKRWGITPKLTGNDAKHYCPR